MKLRQSDLNSEGYFLVKSIKEYENIYFIELEDIKSKKIEDSFLGKYLITDLSFKLIKQKAKNTIYIKIHTVLYRVCMILDTVIYVCSSLRKRPLNHRFLGLHSCPLS